MADMNIFSSRPIERISDVATVRPAGDDKKHGGNAGAFEQMLNSHKNNGGNAHKDSHNSAKPHASGSSDSTGRASGMPMNYGFIDYYNGKAQAAYFCMTESLMDNKA